MPHGKKNSKLVWKDEQEFDRKIRGHIPVRGNSVSEHKNVLKTEKCCWIYKWRHGAISREMDTGV